MNLKFISLNLWFGGILFDDIVQFLKQENADIVVLQEVFHSDDKKLPVHYRSIESLQKFLDYPYYDFAPAVYDKFPWGSVLNGNAVLSKYPIIDRNVTFFDRELDMQNPRSPFDPEFYPVTPRNLQQATLQTQAGNLNIFNFQGVWDMDGDKVSPQRQKMSDTIMKAIEGKQNVIVAGDTNAKHTNPVMRKIETRLTNVFGDTLTSSFNMKRKENPGYASAVVDMVYADKNFEVIEYRCPDVDISDHLPLIVEFKLNETTL